VQSYLLTQKGALVARVRLHGTRVIMRIPLGPVAEQHTDAQAGNLRALHADASIPAALKAYIPRVLLEGVLDSVPFSVETYIDGDNAANLTSVRQLDAAVSQAIAFIGTLHARPPGRAPTPLVAADYERLFSPCLRSIRALIRDDDGTVDTVLDDIDKYLRPALLAHPLPRVWSMGDFAISNLIVDAAGPRLQGVIDWDRASPAGLPLLDLMHLLASWTRRTHSLSAADVFADILLPGRLSAGQRALLMGYCEQVALPAEMIRPLTVAWWLTFVHGRLDYHAAYDERFVAAVRRTLDAIRDAL
jgi:aminoglycoside phosphotransferase (APT) family kinase protein